MENTQRQVNSTSPNLASNLDVKKAWVEPSITEIPKFAILGGPNSGKAEGGTLLGSV